MPKKLTVVLPCYGQLSLARRSFEYLKNQTFKDFDVVILDDNSPENYQILIAEFPSLNISYIKNENNLGAMENIYKSIFYTTLSKYKMSLHEDDILHPEYFEKAIKILDNHENVIFLGTEGVWFKDGEKINFPNTTDEYLKFNEQELGKYFLEQNRMIFGSIIYRNNIPKINFDIEKYDVLCDRPFLLNLIGSSQSILMKSKFIFVRKHGSNDTRGISIRSKHLFNLYENYRKYFNQNDQSIKKYLKITTNSLLLSFPLFRKLSLISLIKEGSRLGLIRLKYINIKGIYGVIRFYI